MLQALNPKNRAVLIVEDDPDDAAILQRALKTFGIRRMFFATTAEEAIQLLARKDCDAALIDYNLPGMNGVRLLEQLREAQPGLPVVLVTGLRDEMIAVEAMKAGAADYVTKDELLTSRIIRTLQVTLRGRVTAEEHERRTVLSADGDKLRVAIEEAEWQLGLSGGATALDDTGEGTAGDLLYLGRAFVRYLNECFRRFPERARNEEEALARMFLERGSGPNEVLNVYHASLRALEAEGAQPPFNPAVALARLLAGLLNRYQQIVSLNALDGEGANAAAPRIPPAAAPDRADGPTA